MPSRTFTMSDGRPFSRKSKRDRTTAGRNDGSSASNADLTAEENRSGLCITTSTRKVRPGQSQLAALPVQIGDGLSHVAHGAGAHPRPVVEHPVDGGFTQPRLTGDLPNRVGVSHGPHSDGSLRPPQGWPHASPPA